MTFDEACFEKFERGRKEHGHPWNAEHIDARFEMMQELTDLANYSTLMENELGRRIYATAKSLWGELEKGCVAHTRCPAPNVCPLACPSCAFQPKAVDSQS